MILEVAILQVRPDQEREFEATFCKAQEIIAGSTGYISHQLQQCIEQAGRYLLLVNWENLEDHTLGFRESEQYQEWRRMLHHFYNPFPEVQHYKVVFENSLDCRPSG